MFSAFSRSRSRAISTGGSVVRSSNLTEYRSMSVSVNGNRSFRRGDPADRDLLLHEVDLGLFHRELGDYEELLLLLPLAQPKVRYGRSQAGEPECRPVLPLGKTVAGSRIERPTVDIEPHGIAV